GGEKRGGGGGSGLGAGAQAGGADGRERRSRVGPRPPPGRADGADGRGGVAAEDSGRPRRGAARVAGGSVGGGRADAQDRVVRRPAAVRPVDHDGTADPQRGDGGAGPRGQGGRGE